MLDHFETKFVSVAKKDRSKSMHPPNNCELRMETTDLHNQQHLREVEADAYSIAKRMRVKHGDKAILLK